MFDAVAFLPVDLKLLPAFRALERARRFLRQRCSRTAIRTHAVGSPKMRWRFLVFRGAVHDAPALRGSLRDLEPCAQHTDLAVIDFDNCLEIRELDHAVPGPAAHLEGDIGLQAGKQNSHHGSWLGRREWARAQYSDQR